MHFPDSSDVEAYTDAKPPSPSHLSPLTSYSNACWGSQIGSAVRDGTLLPLFKCRSMSGGITFRQGGPIAWIAVRQEQTSLSSCEAEICATNEVSKLLMGICNLAESIHSSGFAIPDTTATSPLYNDNEFCVHWSHNMTTKQIRHMEMRENAMHEGARFLHSRLGQPCRYLHKGNAGWCSFLALARFLHVFTVQLSSAVSFRRSSLMPAGRAPPTAGSTVRGFFVCVYQQGFVSFVIMLLSVISDFGSYFTSF